ncbi:histidine phosphatase family protein [Halalkalibacter sp. APA_J-10(15)]|uniref:histidine phosphatase family protein n=1 Tax=Halalkalibacter sp. APA_J-10(15) TaxID=2933805 RepID=UPI001FF55093|nr:histidine phosphatase family protein [Halalkalibacter sp. APA_J-10(15)]MCK0473178.1 phosphoglycerate mutase family protein [Halalkalibacter sp. APA_J-10(15)]
MKKVYVIRHCEAEGQPPVSPLTNRGLKQAIELAAFFENSKVERIISSPYKRAIQTIQPLAKQVNVEIEVNRQLKERVLSTNYLSDWPEKLRNTFEDFELKFDGGESSQEAAKRITEVVEDVFKGAFENTIIVSHGNLISLLLNSYNKDFGFNDWSNLSNPDVYLLKSENKKVTFERVWR